MDGNKRWSSVNSKNIKESYVAGLNKLFEICNLCIKKEIKYVSAYALSAENINRPNIKTIFGIIRDKSQEKSQNFFQKNKIKVKFIGEIDDLPKKTALILNKIEKMTKDNEVLNLNIVMNYGTIKEIVKIVKDVNKENNSQEIDSNLIKKHMYLRGMPEPDMLIRTGGFRRLSNFLLIYMNYTEFFFTETLWPDFSYTEFNEMINSFKKIKRNYGL